MSSWDMFDCVFGFFSSVLKNGHQSKQTVHNNSAVDPLPRSILHCKVSLCYVFLTQRMKRNANDAC